MQVHGVTAVCRESQINSDTLPPILAVKQQTAKSYTWFHRYEYDFICVCVYMYEFIHEPIYCDFIPICIHTICTHDFIYETIQLASELQSYAWDLNSQPIKCRQCSIISEFRCLM